MPKSQTAYRSRHRARQHAEAHDADDGQRAEVPDHPLIPAGKPILIEDEAGLTEALDALHDAGTFAYDTEFIGEETYHPVLCLIQVATTENVWLIDPMNGLDVMEVWDLIADPQVRTLVHAGEQDLEPVVRHLGEPPANVFDTQIAAGLAGMAWPTSLAKLVGELAGVPLGKGLTFTDWAQRPLSGKQKHYAADDVRYLPAVAAALDEDLERRGHPAWAQAECDAACASRPPRVRPRPRRPPGQGRRRRSTRTSVPVLREHLVAWRDVLAREHDLPVRAFVKDEAIVAICTQDAS